MLRVGDRSHPLGPPHWSIHSDADHPVPHSRKAGGVPDVVIPGTRPGISVAVVLRLLGASDVHAEVLGLTLGQVGEPDAKGIEVQAGDLLVEVLGRT
jgi:hypothetical protein